MTRTIDSDSAQRNLKRLLREIDSEIQAIPGLVYNYRKGAYEVLSNQKIDPNGRLYRRGQLADDTQKKLQERLDNLEAKKEQAKEALSALRRDDRDHKT